MRLAGLLRTHSHLKLLAFVVTGLVAGLSYAAIVAVIDAAVMQKAAWTALAAWLVGACALHLAARLACTQIMLDLAQAILHRLRIDLCRRILATPQEELRAVGKPELLTVLTQDIESLAGGYEGMVELFRNGVVIAACLAYLGWQYWPFLLVFGGLLVVGMRLVDRLKRGPTRILTQVRAEQEDLFGRLRNLVEGTRELQLNRRRGRDYVDRIVAPQADGIRRALVRGLMGFSLVLGAGEVVYFLAIGVLLFVLPRWLSVPPGAGAGAAITLLFMSAPINDALQALPRVSRAAAALDHMNALERLVPASERLSPLVFPAVSPTRLVWHDVIYQYAGQQNAGFKLGPLNLSVGGGEVIFLVGGNGAGKSTLAMVLVGLFPADAGEIRLNGQKLTEHNRASYCEHFSAIFSDFHLFETLPDDVANLDERATRYLELLELNRKVQVENGRFSTLDLSSGQRKRLAMVGALLEDRPIYLFDEWAADQDPVFKRLFYNTFLPDLKAAGKLVIVITHDDAYFDCADILLRLDNGSLFSAAVPASTVS